MKNPQHQSKSSKSSEGACVLHLIVGRNKDHTFARNPVKWYTLGVVEAERMQIRDTRTHYRTVEVMCGYSPGRIKALEYTKNTISLVTPRPTSSHSSTSGATRTTRRTHIHFPPPAVFCCPHAPPPPFNGEPRTYMPHQGGSPAEGEGRWLFSLPGSETRRLRSDCSFKRIHRIRPPN
ncbi:hypothetical protein J6590_037438 [Homalodisca vitripennis]|nr:hypothetical protein J6590_037438 [Homalodisca vitripennis]